MRPGPETRATLRAEYSFATWSPAAMTLRAPAARLALDRVQRADLLARAVARELVELEMTFVAYEQRPGVRNRKSVRFRDGSLVAMGHTGKGRPMLRDHEQGDVRARAGTITASATTKLAEGYELRQTALLTAPWAVELALRELVDTVSIGWHATGPVLCSVCNTEALEGCFHMPGDVIPAKGKRPEQVAEWVYTSAVLTETSIVSVPGVVAARVDDIRQPAPGLNAPAAPSSVLAPYVVRGMYGEDLSRCRVGKFEPRPGQVYRHPVTGELTFTNPYNDLGGLK